MSRTGVVDVNRDCKKRVRQVFVQDEFPPLKSKEDFLAIYGRPTEKIRRSININGVKSTACFWQRGEKRARRDEMATKSVCTKLIYTASEIEWNSYKWYVRQVELWRNVFKNSKKTLYVFYLYADRIYVAWAFGMVSVETYHSDKFSIKKKPSVFGGFFSVFDCQNGDIREGFGRRLKTSFLETYFWVFEKSHTYPILLPRDIAETTDQTRFPCKYWLSTGRHPSPVQWTIIGKITFFSGHSVVNYKNWEPMIEFKGVDTFDGVT